MTAQIILNLFIAFLWTLISDEPEMQFTTFVFGYIVGMGIVFLMHRLFGDRFYLVRVWAVIKLVLIFLRETANSFVWVLGHILSPKVRYRPGIFKFETQLRGDWEITTISLLLTLTPGSVVMEVSPDENYLYIHGMDLKESKQNLVDSLHTFEKAIMEVTR